KAEEDLERGQTQLDLLQAQTSYQSGDGGELVTLSLADRFDTVLDSGRKVASALRDQTIYEQARLAALRLLRGQKCAVLQVDMEREDGTFTPALGDLDQPFQKSLIISSLQAASAVAAAADEQEESAAGS